MSAIGQFPFEQAVWFFPACLTLHFLEEATGFAAWARQHLSPRYTESHWRRVHVTGAVAGVLAAGMVSRWPSALSAFLFAAFFVAPMVFNALFHLGGSLYFRSYSPGTASAALLFPALCWRLVALACDAQLLDAVSTMGAMLIGAIVHCIDLAATTFFVTASGPGVPARD
jgi:Protein of unknown function with HXXEE motif